MLLGTPVVLVRPSKADPRVLPTGSRGFVCNSLRVRTNKFVEPVSLVLFYTRGHSKKFVPREYIVRDSELTPIPLETNDPRLLLLWTFALSGCVKRGRNIAWTAARYVHKVYKDVLVVNCSIFALTYNIWRDGPAIIEKLYRHYLGDDLVDRLEIPDSIYNPRRLLSNVAFKELKTVTNPNIIRNIGFEYKLFLGSVSNLPFMPVVSINNYKRLERFERSFCENITLR